MHSVFDIACFVLFVVLWMMFYWVLMLAYVMTALWHNWSSAATSAGVEN